MSELGDKLRASRESWVEVSGFNFRIRYPTDLEMIRWRKDAMEVFLSKTVIDWKMKELDLLTGGGGRQVEFDLDAFIEWVGNKPKIGAEIQQKVVAAYSTGFKAREEQQKN